MAETIDFNPDKSMPLSRSQEQSRAHADKANEALREALKRCPACTYEAARKFRRTRDAGQLPVIVLGIIEHYVEPELRPKLETAGDELRLTEDLGIDSLTRIEIVMLVEEVLEIEIADKELARLQTLGEVRRCVECLANDPSSAAWPSKHTA